MKYLTILFILIPVLAWSQAEIIGRSLDFELGDSDYVYADFDYDYGNDRFGCISAWVKLESIGTYMSVFNWGYGAANTALDMGIMNSGYVWIQGVINGSGVRGVRGGTLLQTGVWYHIVWYGNDTDAYWKIYVNGQLEELTVVNTANAGYWFDTVAASDTMTFGARFQNGTYDRYFDGMIAEIASFDDTLSAAEVTTIYNGGYLYDLTGTTHLQDWWRLSEGAGTLTYDERGYREVNYTFVNTPVWSTSTAPDSILILNNSITTLNATITTKNAQIADLQKKTNRSHLAW